MMIAVSLLAGPVIVPFFRHVVRSLSAHLPPGAGGVFLAALFGAGMAMLASDLNCLATVSITDFYRHWHPHASARRCLRLGRICVCAGGVLAAGIAWVLAHMPGAALALYYAATSIVAGGLAGIFLLSFLCARGNGVRRSDGNRSQPRLHSLGDSHLGRAPVSRGSSVSLYVARLSDRRCRPVNCPRGWVRRELAFTANYFTNHRNDNLELETPAAPGIIAVTEQYATSTHAFFEAVLNRLESAKRSICLSREIAGFPAELLDCCQFIRLAQARIAGVSTNVRHRENATIWAGNRC
jgi:hypothetical protein